jgi:hypothetical protein
MKPLWLRLEPHSVKRMFPHTFMGAITEHCVTKALIAAACVFFTESAPILFSAEVVRKLEVS